MGYARYLLADGREAGYGVLDVCNLDGCDESIDRGVAQLCGDLGDGGEHGCGRYFCDGHLFYAVARGGLFVDPPDQLCTECVARWDAAGHDQHPYGCLDRNGVTRPEGLRP